MIKKFAIYLPQFHRIPENDAWWGEGFTEWTNVKSATPLYKGHRHPKVPLNNNYYTLDNSDVLKWQAEIAKKYKIDGMVFYHYYFCGKMLLEKPAEILLKDKSIEMPFFFYWANHTWAKTWDGTRTILQEQIYGDILNWEEHFKYMLVFFKDSRYEKIDNKPVLAIFKPDFSEFSEMMNYFNKRCIEEGFPGIYVILTATNYNDIKKYDTDRYEFESNVYIREPDSALSELRSKLNFLFYRLINKTQFILKIGNYSPIQRINGNAVYKVMINKNINHRFIRGVFFEWDNTARHKERGYVVSAPSKQIFIKYMNSIKDSQYLFVNAWNEWAEGMILEPTEENGYKYLEWIKEWIEENEEI